MRTLDGKIALVTGASRGIGRNIAERLAHLGASIAVNYSSSRGAAEECVASIIRAGGKAVALQADLSDVAQISTLFDQTRQQLGEIDIVVANAGLELVDIATTDFTEEQFDRGFGINTKGTFFTLQAAARHITANGRIIFIGSSATEFATPGHALYGGTKIAPRFLVEVMAKELGARGVTVNSIHPTAIVGAGVGTKGLRPSVQQYIEQNNPMKRAGSLDDVADAVEYLAGPLSAYVSGQHLLLTGGAAA